MSLCLVPEVDPYQEPCPDPHRALSEVDQLTARRLGVAAPTADRQEGGQEIRKEKKKSRSPRRSSWTLIRADSDPNTPQTSGNIS